MHQPTSSTTTRNHLLLSLSIADRDLLQPHLEPSALDLRRVLEEPHQPIPHVYFPESGIASIVAQDRSNRRIEVGLFGREGMSGSTVVTGNDRSPHECFIQVAGSAQRIPADELRSAMQRSPSLHGLLLRYVQAFLIQTAHTALANGRSKLEERLARWLLMSHDRVDGDDLPLTHEFLALMLGVRRPGVTTALHGLERHGLIRSSRSKVQIIDRAGLIEVADGSYGIPEAELRRLVGSALSN
jgi:CRP-like cAMP-binding protein